LLQPAVALDQSSVEMVSGVRCQVSGYRDTTAEVLSLTCPPRKSCRAFCNLSPVLSPLSVFYHLLSDIRLLRAVV